MSKRYTYVVESTDLPCTDCGNNGRHYDQPNLGFWFNVEWSPGTWPGHGVFGEAPTLVLCSRCRQDAEIGQVVGPELPK